MHITTLIPAYKSKYIPELLNSLRHQSVKSNRILFSDDSPAGEYRKILLSNEMKVLSEGLNIEIIEGPRNGAYENVKHVVRNLNSDSYLVHLMFDDDVIYPRFYERHLVMHASSDISCSISPRWTANENGLLLAGQSPPNAVEFSPNRILTIDNEVIFQTTVGECKNWFGEFSNTVMRSNTCHLLLNPQLNDISYAGLWDLGYFISASLHKPIGYLQEYLGFFRTGGTGNSADIFGPYVKAGVIGYVALAIIGNKIGKITNEHAMYCYTTISSVINHHYSKEKDLIDICASLRSLSNGNYKAEEDFLDAWLIFLKSKNF